jgi:hypothetical protein
MLPFMLFMYTMKVGVHHATITHHFRGSCLKPHQR